MLDLLSLAFSCGIQSEMDTVRKNTTSNALASAEEPVAEASTMSYVAESMDSAMCYVENTVCGAVSSVATALAPEVEVAPVCKK